MANTMDNQPRDVALWNGHPVVVINESDGSDTYFHGVMIGPVGMEYDEALAKLDQAFSDAVKAAGDDDWNYDDVIEGMKAAGFEEVRAAVWDEADAPVPGD